MLYRYYLKEGRIEEVRGRNEVVQGRIEAVVVVEGVAAGGECCYLSVHTMHFQIVLSRYYQQAKECVDNNYIKIIIIINYTI